MPNKPEPQGPPNEQLISCLAISLLVGACATEADPVTRIDAHSLEGGAHLELDLVDGHRYQLDTSRGPVDLSRVTFVDGSARVPASTVIPAGDSYEVVADDTDTGWSLRLQTLVPEGAALVSRCQEWGSYETHVYDSNGNYLWSVTTYYCIA